MKVLLTGAFGNLGFWTLQELLQRGHTVRCFDLKTDKTVAKAKLVAGKAEVVWGNLRQADEVAAAVQGQDLIVHLGFIIPPATGEDPAEAYEVNVGGTRNVLEAARSQQERPKLLFASSFDVYGPTQDKEPPRTVNDPVQPTDAYSEHKIQCEDLVKQSGLEWAIYRFCDMPPLPPATPHKPHPIMFTIPLKQRFEMLHPRDGAMAIACGLESPIWGKIWLIGGGSSCQIRYGDYLQTMMERMGVGRLPEEAFTSEPYCTDWVDSSESQVLLNYQRHSFQQIIDELAAATDPGPVAHLLMPLLRPFVRRSILKMSPYLKRT
ncbi:MAG TPA: NAD(P)-dependent oxidoreductase [Ktedonobacteraceae bacterium]|nr:NAD(P)-dependent oxidoreductase [Ktedonobacteraceae bacterium]